MAVITVYIVLVNIHNIHTVRGRTFISIVFCPPLYLHKMYTLLLLYEMLMCAGNKLNWIELKTLIIYKLIETSYIVYSSNVFYLKSIPYFHFLNHLLCTFTMIGHVRLFTFLFHSAKLEHSAFALFKITHKLCIDSASCCGDNGLWICLHISSLMNFPLWSCGILCGHHS